MPWKVVSGHAGCPSSKPWAVVKTDDNSVAGCHPSKSAADKQLAALYASEGTSEMSDRAEKLLGAPERRSIAADDFEVRRDGDSLRLIGYASVFERRYSVFGGPPHGFTEIVDRAAFNKTLGDSPDVHLLANHEGLTLARTKSGTLKLSADSTGLKVEANLDRRDPDVQRLEVKMERRDLDEMSFSFRTVRQEWDNDETERRLLEVNINKADVSVVNHGANPATSAQLRSIDDVLTWLDAVEVEQTLAELRNGGQNKRAEIARARNVLAHLERALTAPRQRTLTRSEALAVIEDGQ